MKDRWFCLKGIFCLLAVCVMFAAACRNPVSPEKGNKPTPAIPANKAPLNEKINTADELFNRLVTSD
ncbi:MAG: hypothetical protein LBG95_02090, partial [Treponema sp.]|nr:hypothetical protein [Treponema sp.]